jgi:hypothetical protein
VLKRLPIDSLTVGLLLSLLLTGCAYSGLPQETRKEYRYEPVPKVIVTPLPAKEKRLTLKALAAGIGMKISIDMKKGYRYLSDGRQAITIMPGRREAIVNGSQTRIDHPVMWQNGVLVAHENLGQRLSHALRDNPILKRPVAVVKNVSHKRTKLKSSWTGPIPAIPHGWDFPANRAWKYIVIHHSATRVGGARSFHRGHAKKWKYGLGYHFVVGNGSETRVGQVEIGRRWRLQNQGIHGAHAGIRRYNQSGIGICLVGNFQKSGPTNQQLKALRQLVVLLMKRYKISKSRVLGHKHARPGHTDCPGRNFPWRPFISSL